MSKVEDRAREIVEQLDKLALQPHKRIELIQTLIEASSPQTERSELGMWPIKKMSKEELLKLYPNQASVSDEEIDNLALECFEDTDQWRFCDARLFFRKAMELSAEVMKNNQKVSVDNKFGVRFNTTWKAIEEGFQNRFPTDEEIQAEAENYTRQTGNTQSRLDFSIAARWMRDKLIEASKLNPERVMLK